MGRRRGSRSTAALTMKNGPPLIAGFDIATSCGCAHGVAGVRPRVWTWNLREHGKVRTDKLAALMRYCERYFASYRVDALFYEKPLPISALLAQAQKGGVQAAFRMGATEDTIALLRGAIGVIEACAARAGVPRIEAVSVQEARTHLLGRGHIPKGQGKALVRERCRVLGWHTANEDESDACAIWSLGCGLMSPMAAHMSTPLFSNAR